MATETVVFNLGARYAAAFGMLALNNKPQRVTISKTDNRYFLDTYDAIDRSFEAVQFSYNNIDVLFSGLPFVKSPELGTILAPPPLMVFTKDKQHVETPVNDSDNVVVEYWGTKPWEIRMRGLLIDVENRRYPSDKIKTLHQMFRYNGVVGVAGTQFLEKDVYSVYFKNVEIMGVEGFEDTVQYTMTLSAIAPVEFTLNKPI